MFLALQKKKNYKFAIEILAEISMNEIKFNFFNIELSQLLIFI
jgi:hypothetical protein